MADIAKYAPINGGALMTDFKTHFSIFRAKRTVALAYGFVFVFIAFTIFLAFSPSSNSSSPRFTNIFTLSTSSNSSIFSDESYRSHFSSIFYYFFPNSSSSSHPINSSPTDSAGSQNSVFLPPHLSEQPSALQNQSKNDPSKPNNATIVPNKPFLNQNGSNSSNPSKTSSNLSKGSVNFNNQTQNKQLNDKGEGLKQNQTQNKQLNDKGEALTQNQTKTEGKVEVLKQNQTKTEDKVEVLKQNHTKSEDKVEVLKGNQSSVGVTKPPSVVKNATENGEKGIVENGSAVKNLTNSLMKQQKNDTDNAKSEKGIDDLIKSLINCDFFDGNWVRDESYPLYKPGSCSLIDEQFNCFLNGRPDNGYLKLKWKPKGCTLPRLSGGHMLEMLRGKRLVFVGDSLNRNMWESLICILRNSVKDQKKVYEEFGRHHFRGEASYSFVFEDYKCKVEFFVSPFLVQEWEVKDKNGTKKETLRLDLIGRSADKYKDADIIVFNTGHWWTHDKTSKGKDYYQEGSHVYSELNVVEAFRKATTTWGRWVDANVKRSKSLVFFRGYSASHFSGGQWNSGGQCDHETEPIKNETYLSHYPPKMAVLEKVLRGMKTPVTYLNITRMSDYRKDGHPSIYRKQHLSNEERRSPLRFQDCSHWCLPGVPDAWNEILYAQLLVKLNQKRT